MPILDEAISRYFDTAETPVLFAGAGVSAYAGIPVWRQLLEHLMEQARSRDPLTAAQMGNAIHTGNFLLAAQYFLMTDQIVEGERYRLIVNEMKNYDPTVLMPLVSLPFRAFLTTNFDRSLLDAFSNARRVAVIDYRYGDHSFSQAVWEKEHYVARIHGCVEAPSTIVLTTSAFDDLLKHTAYHDLLSDTFTRKNTLFLGFSFYDPAIRHILEQLDRDYGPTTPGHHLALIPNDVEGEFLTKLARLNIEVVRYAPDDGHRQLWEAVKLVAASRGNQKVGMTSSPHQTEAFATAKQFLAACYARTRLSAGITPLREAVVEGLVSGILQSKAPAGISPAEIVDILHLALGIQRSDAQSLSEKAIASLREEKLCRKHMDGAVPKITWAGIASSESTLDVSISLLVRNARNRALVQEGWHTTSDVSKALDPFFRELILQRGWDLGAAFAAKRPPANVEIGKLLRKFCISLSTIEIERLQRVCESILTQPSDEEAAVLAELGRVSFALELAIQCPRTTLFYSTVLPERIYFDANVLMPALTPGHPYHKIYSHTVSRLEEAAARAASGLQLIACRGILNEIVSHKRLAIELMKELGDGFQEIFRREALYHGASNVNVFVGAYANLTETEPGLQFSDFLRRHAPYNSEAELEQWLKRHGIVVMHEREAIGAQHAELSLSLQKAYSQSLANGKDVRLVDHDAVQLSALAKDRANNKRAILVTADKRLRDIVSRGPFPELAGNMVSHVGLVQMIDLLVGDLGEAQGMTQLLWSARSSEKTESLRSYLIALALNERNEAMAMAMPEVVDRITEEAQTELDRLGVDPGSENPANKARAFRIIGTYEKGFFHALREVIERRERQGG